MKFLTLIKDSKEGLRKNIFSRKENLIVTVGEFNQLSKKYFSSIEKYKNHIIYYDQKDKQILIFVLRWYYKLWIDIRKDLIEVHFTFPKEFEILSEVNKYNHPHTPKIFKKGTVMYYNSSKYNTSNWLRGIPLWDDKDEEVIEGLKPSCQINYNFIKVVK